MSLVDTLMQPLRQKYAPGTMDKNELRFSRYGVMDFFQKQAKLTGGIFTDKVRAAVTESFGKTVQIPVLDAEDVNIGSTRSCTISPSENTSKLLTLSFVTYQFGFTMVPSQHFNNDISYQQDFDRKLNKYLLKLAATIDSQSRNTLETARNKYFPADMLAYYPNVGNAFQVADGEKEDFFNNLEAIVTTADYYDNINILGSTSLMPLVKRLKAQGGSNATNQSFQMNPWMWNFSNRITNGLGQRSTLYAVPDGNVGMLNRNDPDSIAGSSIGEVRKWGVVHVPVVDMDMGYMTYADCGDMSALHAGTTGLTATKVEGFSWHTDVCYVTAYNSDADNRYSPIFKAEISAS